MTTLSKPTVWLVDDRAENRAAFEARHSKEFEIETFETPDQVLTRMSKEKHPDALLCDIFFYEDPAEREMVEAEVMRAAKDLERLADKFHANQAADGIGLIQRIRQRFDNDPPFPIYAYTSKGPYLLHSNNFDQLEELGARWLFKNKYSPQIERRRIATDIDEFRERYEWGPRRLWSVAWRTGLITALIGAILGVVLDRLAKVLGF